MTTTQETRRTLYQGAYRSDLETDIVDTQTEKTEDPTETPEDRTWKKRYGDLRTHTNSLTERIKNLETQLLAAQKQEVKIPSTREELEHFARQYPDIYRHIRSIAMAELLQERENLELQTRSTKEKLESMERELGLKRILQVHPDFEELNMSEQFHTWASEQPKQIQDWLFESTDPNLCIKALDLYKAEMGFKQKKQPAKQERADTAIRTRSNSEPLENLNQKVWKTSDIRKLHPKQYEQLEPEIEKARREGRLEVDE